MADAPNNLPTEGQSLLNNVAKAEDGSSDPQKGTGGSLKEAPKVEDVSQPKEFKGPPLPEKNKNKLKESSDTQEAEDIFADVKETATPQVSGTTSGVENPESEKTEIESPKQGFKKVILTIGAIVIFTGVLAFGGYFAYNQFLKPKSLSPNLNLDTNTNTGQQQTTPTGTTQPTQTVTPADSDNDGLSDSEEQTLGTDPLSPDSDGDGLFDREEVQLYGTDPLVKDTDGDGYEDGAEVQAGYDPKGPGKLIQIPAGQ